MPPRAGSPPPERTRDRERTRAEILAVATQEFSEHGYSGARVDEIAERTRTTKRMLYYYFESKEGLYAEVLKAAYAEIRSKEQAIDVDHLDPVAAIRRIAELTFDHHEAHPDCAPLDLLIVLTNPVSHGAAAVPGRIVPDQQ